MFGAGTMSDNKRKIRLDADKIENNPDMTYAQKAIRHTFKLDQPG